MKYMLDTNICIYIINKKPVTVLRKFTSFSLGEIGISSITLAELMYGVEKSKHAKKNKMALEEFILPLEIFPFDDLASSHYGNIRAYLEKKGITIGPLDLMIAAHARSLEHTVVTNNTKEFERVPKLTFENWVN